MTVTNKLQQHELTERNPRPMWADYIWLFF